MPTDKELKLEAEKEARRKYRFDKSVARNKALAKIADILGIYDSASDAIAEDIAPEIDGGYVENGIGVTEFWGSRENHSSVEWEVEPCHDDGYIMPSVFSLPDEDDLAVGSVTVPHEEGESSVEVEVDVTNLTADRDSLELKYSANDKEYVETVFYWNLEIQYDWRTC